jgi:hypothetical protein
MVAISGHVDAFQHRHYTPGEVIGVQTAHFRLFGM